MRVINDKASEIRMDYIQEVILGDVVINGEIVRKAKK